jgi:hypothetical protein
MWPSEAKLAKYRSTIAQELQKYIEEQVVVETIESSRSDSRHSRIINFESNTVYSVKHNDEIVIFVTQDQPENIFYVTFLMLRRVVL